MNHRERTDNIRESLPSHVREKSSCTRKWILPGLLVLILLLTGCGTLRTGTGGIRNPERTSSDVNNASETAPSSSSDNAQAEMPATSSDNAQTEVPAASSEFVPATSSDNTQKETPAASSGTTQATTPEPSPTISAEASVSGAAASTTPDDSNPSDSGILVKSGNELSSDEKQKLLEELEKELDALFTEINDVSAEEEMEAQN